MQAWSKAYVEKAKAAISAMEVAVNMYKTDIGYYPEDSGGTDCVSLVSAMTTSPSPAGNWHGPYMSFKEDDIVSGNFKDPWGNSYIYDKSPISPPFPSDSNINSYNLYSKGPDGEDDSADGDNDIDDDIANW